MGASRTIFIAGLPDDATEREIYLLFVMSGGCETVDIRLSASHGTVAYVRFQSEQRALAMAAACTGIQYDPTRPHLVLRAEVAPSGGTAPSLKRPLDMGHISPTGGPAPPQMAGTSSQGLYPAAYTSPAAYAAYAAQQTGYGQQSAFPGVTYPTQPSHSAQSNSAALFGPTGDVTHLRNTDGHMYSKAEWRDMYGGYREWDAAVLALTGQHASKQICKDFLNGKCDRGNACRFYHGEDGAGKGLETAFARNTPCKDFRHGRCDRGSQCRFAHVPDDAPAASPDMRVAPLLSAPSLQSTGAAVRITGLSADVASDYLDQLCSTIDGFVRCSVQDLGDQHAATACFATAAEAQRALATLQGHIGGAGISIELAPDRYEA
eukprot:TRINITY_DN15862_c0_g1_i2.p1 TRINITY_DN15862_c0_g1~~TRINITY_DN15862_c0_g1_i2.p1  ORF type:complete len:404 (+),score=64.88 TRINITY_DN15862_c0_g1_i2:84-1214(+)